MAKYHITRSLSMLIAKKRTMTIDHAPVRSREMIVVDVAVLEDGALCMYPHPTSYLGEEYEIYKAAIARGESVVKNKKLRAIYVKIDHVTKRWPPKFGTIEFNEYLGSYDGVRDVFWLSVGRCNQWKRLESDRIAKRLTDREWNNVARIAWGRSIDIPVERKNSRHDDELEIGMDWAFEFYKLETERGWTRDYILQMPISHFLSCLSKPRETIVEIDDEAPNPDRSRSVRFH
jgi:hypothetical protein